MVAQRRAAHIDCGGEGGTEWTRKNLEQLSVIYILSFLGGHVYEGTWLI